MKFLGRIFQFLSAGKSICHLHIYNFWDNIGRYFGRLWKHSTLTKNSCFCDLTRLILNWIYVIGYLFENSCFNNKKCVWESTLCIKSYVRGSLFTLCICKLFSRRGKSFSCILVQFPHELSTTMFVLVNDFHFMVEYVQEKLYFSNFGWKNSFILPCIIVYILKHATRAISFTFNPLAVYCSSIVPHAIDTFH